MKLSRKPRLDLLNKKFDKLTPIEYIGIYKGKTSIWKCKCDCGNITYQKTYNITHHKVVSCGCTKGQEKRRIDITGQRFGKLVAIKYDKKKTRWLCQCDCGRQVFVFGYDLRVGHTQSCGCIPTYNDINQDPRFKKLLKCWDGMKQRCYNPNKKEYKFYGAKGVTICDEWKNDFRAFFHWAIDNGYEIIDDYKDKLNIDRIDSSKGYSPDNCRFISQSDNCARVSEYNQILEKLDDETTDELVKEYYERKVENAKETLEENQKIKKGNYFFRKPNYYLLSNKDNTKCFLFKKQSTIAGFLQISTYSISYRMRKKDGQLNDDFKLEKIDKELFDIFKNKGTEVIV